MEKRGMTLIELMVAVSIFIIVMTLAIGGFIAISRSRILIGNQKDTQQKVRIADEMIVRYSKQANYVKLASDGSSLELYFDISSSQPTAKKFSLKALTIDTYDLIYSECNNVVAGTLVCPNNTWTSEASLLGGDNNSLFLKKPAVVPDGKTFKLNGVLPAVLEVTLEIHNQVPGYETLSDAMTVENAIILESLE